MNDTKRLPARFFETEAGRLPVREWLLKLTEEERRLIGDDIRTAEFGWPIGMPLCRPMKTHKGLWEVRTNLPNGKIARVLFCAHDGQMVLLHGFIKKSQKTPKADLDMGARRMRGLK
ncbi:type II toxin-antitoxin system RelE/ParE family toxin [Roseovarius rhodophyticola]|uniref:Type II toxin-antitoxin system RelE/ParE family toxin n=1 Tax=Roseovarius rhodophyticola TaxID=3080827 RepID=A0ABZ2TIA3_9RHOB|nr:type II toxin-antitoxin system RelE/ParE family toxin [Roseovarius sp. W115]MDV2928075.1 type II toxin-antitoxin system RelE/ParE family toxin [Roseovarius sp. W115]